jgi:hypothetical protein
MILNLKHVSILVSIPECKKNNDEDIFICSFMIIVFYCTSGLKFTHSSEDYCKTQSKNVGYNKQYVYFTM